MSKSVSDIVRKELFEFRDEEYAKFSAGLAPGIEPDTFIGVRVPLLRKYAKDIKKRGISEQFMSELPHKYYDENLLHSILLTDIKDYDKCISMVEEFLPYIDNWAVCDTLRPKVFNKNTDTLITKVKEWSKSDKVYTCRFGIDTLMSCYLDEYYKPEYHDIATQIVSEEYYVNMMIAWYFATALAKQWDSTIPIIEQYKLQKWTHNKTIQKAKESFRITKEQKEYLTTLRVK